MAEVSRRFGSGAYRALLGHGRPALAGSGTEDAQARGALAGWAVDRAPDRPAARLRGADRAACSLRVGLTRSVAAVGLGWDQAVLLSAPPGVGSADAVVAGVLRLTDVRGNGPTLCPSAEAACTGQDRARDRAQSAAGRGSSQRAAMTRQASWRSRVFLSPEMPRAGQQLRRAFGTARLLQRNALLGGSALKAGAELLPGSRAYSQDSEVPPLHRSRTAYYDILRVSPGASQSQIKTAYYKQSFIYHPDKNAGSEEATLRFSEISEAYSVLGSIGLRRKYDHGILSPADVQGATRPSSKGAAATASGPAAQQRSRSSPMAGVGAKPMFDFDAFYQAHYSEQLQREKMLRWRREQQRQCKEDLHKRWQLGKMTEVSVGLLLALGLAILFSLQSSD
ncbi:uncharacterized protein LOC136717941 [Amia ocellicauda]|uniref:uncharacterized protein LOC136717941 n=1 Tax=Amia ocellicauda TaxID=2972642 RepID=UPI003464E535